MICCPKGDWAVDVMRDEEAFHDKLDMPFTLLGAWDTAREMVGFFGLLADTVVCTLFSGFLVGMDQIRISLLMICQGLFTLSSSWRRSYLVLSYLIGLDTSELSAHFSILKLK